MASLVLTVLLHFCALHLDVSGAGDTASTRETIWIPGTLVFCKALKEQKQEDKRRLNTRVEKISNSFAIILDPPTNQEGDRVNIEWLGDGSSSIKIGVKSKYLRPIPQLFIHSLVNYKSEVLKQWKLYPKMLTKLILKDHSKHSMRLIHFTSDEKHSSEMRQSYVRQMRDKSDRKLKRRVTVSDLTVLHLVEEWYDGNFNSTLDMHVAVSAKVDALNNENLMRLCTMMYEENLWKRTSFGLLSESGDITLIRRFLERQVHFVVHSQQEMDEHMLGCIRPILCGFLALSLVSLSAPLLIVVRLTAVERPRFDSVYVKLLLCPLLMMALCTYFDP